MSERDSDRVWNHMQAGSQFQMENGSFVLPTENAITSVSNSIPFLNMPMRSSDYASSSSNADVPPLRLPAPGLPHDPYHIQSTASSSNQFPSNYSHHGPSSSSRHTIYGDEGCFVNSQLENGRGPFKRKRSAAPTVYDVRNTDGFYIGGSSSDVPLSSSHMLQKPILGSHHRPWDPTDMIPNLQGNGIYWDRSHRNVRSRHGNAPHLDANPTGTHFANNVHGHFVSMGNFGPSTSGQWNHNAVAVASSQGRGLSADPGACNVEIVQPHVGSSNSSGLIHTDSGFHHTHTSVRNSSAHLSAFHGPAQGSGGNASNHSLRTPFWRSPPGYPPPETVAQSTNGNVRLASEAFPRRSRPLSIGGPYSGGRDGRARSSYGRSHTLPDAGNTHGRWASEGLAVMDRPIFYHSRHLFDQHQDMRLDVDHMSYEELLALGERIGSVNTGLSEDTIPKCLTETIYCSSDEVQEDQDTGNCVICLEDYKDREELGFLRCGHGYHGCCIKQWLQIKNVCPICKASALEK